MNLASRFARFLQIVGRSCYDMEWYRVVRTRPVAAALRYFAFFNLFIVVLTLVDLVPTSYVALRQARAYVSAKLPEGATLTLKQGELSSDLSQPFDLGSDKVPVVLDSSFAGQEAPAGFVAATGVFIGREAVFLRSGSDVRTVAFKDLPDLNLTKGSVLDWLDRSGPFLLAGALVFYALVYYSASFAAAALFVLLAAALSLLFGRLWRTRLSYRQWVAVGFHAVTLPTLANWLFNEFSLTVPLIFTFLFFMIVVAVIADERAAPTVGPLAPDEPAAGQAAAGPEPAPPRSRRPARPKKPKTPPPTPPATPPAA